MRRGDGDVFLSPRPDGKYCLKGDDCVNKANSQELQLQYLQARQKYDEWQAADEVGREGIPPSSEDHAQEGR